MSDDFDPIQMVSEFQDAFETSKDPALWEKLIEEEIAETEEALANLLKECMDVLYVSAGRAAITGEFEVPDHLRARAERLDTLIDNGLDGLREEAFRRVHESNMSKLGDDGKPVRREDGKVLKGPNYQPPELLDLIRNSE